MKRPFLQFLIPYILGILFFNNFSIKYEYIMVSLFIMILTIFISRFNKFSMIFNILLPFMIAGILLNYNINDSYLKKFDDEIVDTKIIVKEKIDSKEYSSRYNGVVKEVYIDNRKYDLNEKTIIYIEKDNLKYGSTIVGQAKIILPKENTNPKLFNYKQYLMSNKIYAITNILGNYKIIETKKLSKLYNLKRDIKNNIKTTISNGMSEINSRRILAIILGKDDLLEDKEITSFREIGIAHVFAVSGLHIGVLSVFLLFIFRILNINYRIASLLTVICIYLYGYIIDFPISVLRASILFSLLILSRLIHKRLDYINILSFTAVILLLIRPLWLFDIGFQLSFVTTFFIIYLTDKIDRSIFEDVKFSKYLSPVIAVYIGITPILINNFNYLTITSILSNLILVPILSLSIILSFLSILISVISIELGMYILFIIDKLLLIFNYLFYFFDKFINISIISPSLNIFNTILYYSIVYIAFNYKKINKIKFTYRFVAFIYIVIIISSVFISTVTEEWKVDFIDVGQGDSILISIGKKNFLVDTGGRAFGDFDVGERVIEPYLLKNGISYIDGVFITHFHDDHCKGLISILKNDRIKIQNIFIGYKNENNELYNKINKLAKKKKINIININKGDKISIKEGIYIDVLNPLSDEINNTENNMSLTMLLRLNDIDMLLTGDIEKEIEKLLIEDIDDIEILKVPHHGSNTSSTQNFIEKSKPEIAIISVGKNNYGHPNKEVLNRIKDSRAKIYRTDKNGLIRIENSNGSFKINTYKDKSFLCFDSYLASNILLLFLMIYIYIRYDFDIKEFYNDI